MKRLVFFISGLSFLVSCAHQPPPQPPAVEPDQVAPPKHLIHGRWESTSKVKNAPNFNFTFFEDNLLKTETFSTKGDAETKYYDYEIVDHRTATFYYTENVSGEKVSIKAQIVGDDTIGINCFYTDNPETNFLIDPALLCFYKDFKRI